MLLLLALWHPLSPGRILHQSIKTSSKVTYSNRKCLREVWAAVLLCPVSVEVVGDVVQRHTDPEYSVKLLHTIVAHREALEEHQERFLEVTDVVFNDA